jgi:predicted amidohydrolase
MVRIAALQMTSGTSPADNLEALAALAHEAAADGAEYALSPEVSVAFAENREGLRAVAGPWEGNPAIIRCAQIAREAGLSLHLGSLAVALPDGRFANRSVLFRPDGSIAATYDKIHLFDATLPGLREYRESATYAGGDTAVVAEAAGLRLGFTICYDLRFPALHRVLAGAGAEMIAVPAGQHENGRATYGHSMIVDPWGKVLGELGGQEPGVLVADIDPKAVAEARERVPALANGRQFSLSVNPTGASS